MNKKILEYPNPILKKLAPEAVIGDSFTEQVIEDLGDSFRVIQGYGLAAPQIGYSTRAMVISPRALGISEEDQLLMLNPRITNLDKELTVSREACFSVPDITASVKRHASCTVEFQDAKGTQHEISLNGLPAFCVQHEVDHLDGKTMLDRVGRMSRSRLLKKRRKIQEEKQRIEEEYRREFEQDQTLYLTDDDGKPKRISKTSRSKKRMQRLSRKLNQKKRKKK